MMYSSNICELFAVDESYVDEDDVYEVVLGDVDEIDVRDAKDRVEILNM